MKIALVANRFPSLSETFIYNHAAGLSAAGIDTTVITTQLDHDGELFRDFDGVKFTGQIRSPILRGNPLATARAFAGELPHAGGRLSSLLRQARARYGSGKRALRAALLALPFDDYDIVHLEYSGLAVSWFDALPLRTRAKLVVSCRGAAEQITPLVEPERAQRLRDVFAAADRVHCVSLDMLRTCEQYGLSADKAFINRPAIDAKRFQRKRPYVARERGPYRLLTTGRLHWKKGLEYAVVAIRQLLDAGHDVAYDIVGGGREEERLRFAVHELGLADHVRFTGPRSSTAVRAALEEADIYLLPSLSEGISNAALEAMAMGVPLVTTAAGGMNEAVRDGVDGIVVRSRDPEALAASVAALLKDPARRLQLARSGRERLESEFTLERQVAVYVREYGALLASSS